MRIYLLRRFCTQTSNFIVIHTLHILFEASDIFVTITKTRTKMTACS